MTQKEKDGFTFEQFMSVKRTGQVTIDKSQTFSRTVKLNRIFIYDLLT